MSFIPQLARFQRFGWPTPWGFVFCLPHAGKDGDLFFARKRGS